VSGDAERCEFVLRSKGLNARIPPHAEALIAGSPEGGTVDAHGIQPFYAGMVARAAGMRVTFGLEGDEVTIRAATV
jgi:histidine phosphotransferase ChpT